MGFTSFQHDLLKQTHNYCNGLRFETSVRTEQEESHFNVLLLKSLKSCIFF